MPAVKEYLDVVHKLYHDREHAVKFMDDVDDRMKKLEAQPSHLVERNRVLDFDNKKLKAEIDRLRKGIEEYFLCVGLEDLNVQNPEFTSVVELVTGVNEKQYPEK
jgi:hypothetical protein